MKIEPNFFGKDGFYWWVGVVEDRQDPLMLGRLRVRVLGCHTDDKTLIPTCKLQWAYPYQPITWNLAMNGLGHSPTGPVEGTWVYGFYKDNQSAQDPVVTGVMAGVPSQAPLPCTGFFDPSQPFHNYNTAPRKIKSRWYPNDGTGAHLIDETTASLYPRATHPWGCIIGESDINRLARNENSDDTIIGVRNRQRDVHVPIAFAHITPARMWNEPESSYDAVYPYNHVYESESGHIFEIDDTPGAERVHFYHRSGTYIEVNGGTSGDFQMKVVGKRYEVTMENAYSHFQNTLNVTVQGETNIYVQQNANIQVDGDVNMHVGGNYTEKIKGDYYTDIGGNRLVRIAGTDTLNVGEDRTVIVGGDDSVEVDGSELITASSDVSIGAGDNVNIAAGGSITESAGGVVDMTAGSHIAGDAGSIFWNSGASSGTSVEGPGSPAAPSIPEFPDPTDIVETIDETGPDPVLEVKSDPNPTTCGGQTDC